MPTANRFVALDVFRGMAVAAMIVVNAPGNSDAVFAPLRHAAWHGCTLADGVFPSFLFAVGYSLVFVWPKWEQANWATRWQLLAKRVGRWCLLGWLLHAFPFVYMTDDGHWQLFSIGHLRIMGVLQRIALTYALVIVFITLFRSQRSWAIGAVVVLVGYWAALAIGGGFAIQGNLVQTIDVAVLGTHHLYQIDAHFFDPEGLLSTLPACVNVLAGYWLGLLMQRRGNVGGMWWQALVVAIALILVGIVWHAYFPINKYLWTSSFVVVTVGADILLLLAIQGFLQQPTMASWGLFFEVMGKNALFLYVVSECLVSILYTLPVNGDSVYYWLYEHLFAHWLPPHWASCGFAATFLLVCWGAAYIMHIKRWYVKW